MAEQASKRRAITFRVLTLAGLVLLALAYFSPVWWVSLKAPNYPEATFPDGIRIHFHMDSVRNGCSIRQSKEVEETEALDCVHEMDTINHYVGMYPIASGGPVEKAFSPFLFAMLGVMLVAFMIPGGKKRVAFSLLGHSAVAAWMIVAMYSANGVAYQGKGYLEGLVNSLGQDTMEKIDDSNLAPIVKLLKESLEKSAAAGSQEKSGDTGGSKADLIANLRANYNLDNLKKPGDRQQAWTGSGLQVMTWHYDKSLGRWFNMPERNDRLAATMDMAAKILLFAVIGAMLLMVYAARSTRSMFYWLLVLLPAAVSPGFIVEYSAWLWWYGHSLNEMGAFTLKPFMPTVFGEGKVAQFTTYSYPHYGFGLLAVSTLLLILAALIRHKQLQEAGDAAEDI